MIELLVQALNDMSSNHYFSDPVHGNFVTYAWLFGAVGTGMLVVSTIIGVLVAGYTGRKVSKEYCDEVHRNLCSNIEEIKETIGELSQSSLANHDSLVKIETLLNAKIKQDAETLAFKDMFLQEMRKGRDK